MIFSWKKIGLGIIATLLLITNTGSVVFAQSAEDVYSYASSVNESDFDFEMTPENPGPRQTLSLSLSSNLVDLNRYPITWTVDGAVVASGIGKKSITTQTKDYGQTTTISMSIKLIESEITKRISITPQDTTIIWEAVDSYAPPFYQGKRLPSYESIVRITSIPNFLGNKQSVATKNAVYIWKRNNSAVTDASGFGKDSILIQHNRVRPTETITATASSVSASGQATASVTIPFLNPFVLIYARDPVTGIRNPLTKKVIPVPTKGLTLEAEPYFFSVLQNNPNFLKLSWSLNDTPVTLTDARKKTTLSLTNSGGGGTATIRVDAENTTKLFQSTTTTIGANLLQ